MPFLSQILNHLLFLCLVLSPKPFLSLASRDKESLLRHSPLRPHPPRHERFAG
jgi:hypothetical protein